MSNSFMSISETTPACLSTPVQTTDAESGRDMAKIGNAERLARAVLLFHGSGTWGDQQREVWTALTGEHDATTRVLCDLARRIRDQEESA